MTSRDYRDGTGGTSTEVVLPLGDATQPSLFFFGEFRSLSGNPQSRVDLLIITKPRHTYELPSLPSPLLGRTATLPLLHPSTRNGLV
jgi:hypothetical protein